MTRARGGAALLAVFLLLAVMASVGLATSRNLMRELAICGEALQGARAAAAAESGLAWFLGQCAGEGWRSRLDPVRGAGQGYVLAPAGDLLAGFPDQGPDQALRLTFQVRVQFLGALPPAEAGRAEELLWRVTATGRCAVPGHDEGGFHQARELLLASPGEDPDPPRGPRILAWRAVTPDL